MFRSGSLLLLTFLSARGSCPFAIRRLFVLQRTALSTRWSSTRRARYDRDGRSFTTKDVLHGRREWRSVSHDRQRRDLDADH